MKKNFSDRKNIGVLKLIAVIAVVLFAGNYSSAEAKSPELQRGMEYARGRLALISEEARRQLELIDAGIPRPSETSTRQVRPLPETANKAVPQPEVVREAGQFFSFDIFGKFISNFTNKTADIASLYKSIVSSVAFFSNQTANVVSSYASIYASAAADFFDNVLTVGKSSLERNIATVRQTNKKVSVNFTNQTADIASFTSSLITPITDFFTNLFTGGESSELETIIPIKQSEDESDGYQTESSSSSSVIPAQAGIQELSNEFDNPRVATSSSESATYNLPPTTYNLPPTTSNLKPDITRREVLDLISRSDLGNQTLLGALMEASKENSLTVNQSISNLENRISTIQSNNIRQLDKPAAFVSRTDSDIKNLSGTTIADSTITSSSFSGTTGTFTGALTGTTGIFSGNLTVSSQLTVAGTATSTVAGDTNFDSGTLYIDSINNRVGISTTSPYAKLSVVGPVVAEYFHAPSTPATSTFSGQLVSGFAPTLAHNFGSWSVGASGANPLGASFIINPSSAVSDSNLLSLSVNGSAKFLVDAEGDIFANAVTVVGGTTLSTTTAATVTVETNTNLGDSTTTDITYFNSRIADSLIPTADNALDLGDPSNWLRWRTGYFGTSVGIGGTATSTGSQLTTSGASLVDSNGTLSINTTNNKAVSFGTGNISLPYASSTALTVTGSTYLTGLGQGWIHTAGGVNALTSSTSPTVAYLTATSTTATSTFPYLSVTTNSNLGTVVGGTWQGAAVGSTYGGTGINSSALTGIAQIVAGTWSASSTLAVAYGGTGWNSLQANTVLLGNGAGAVATTSAGTDGFVLALSAGVPTWLATSTLSTITGTLSVAKGGTGQISFGQGWLHSDGTTLTSSTSPTVAYLTATSTTATSTFPYLSITTNSNLGTVVGGTWQGAAIGDGYLTKTGDWTGTLDTYNGSDLLARVNHTGTQGVSTLSNYDFSFASNYGTNNLISSTTMPWWAQGGINASSTSHFLYASSTALTVSGNSYLGTVSSGAWNGTAVSNQYGGTGIDSSALTGIAQITAGTWSASSTLSAAYGGTGWNNIQANTLLLGNGAGRIATTTAGTDGFVLALSAGVPTWLATSTLSTITGTLAAAKGGTGIDSSSLTGIAQIVAGTWSASSTLAVAYGGTGWNAIQAGYIPFGNGASAIATSSSFYWDNGNSRLGIGTTTPNSRLTVFNNADDSAIEFSSASGSTYKWTMGMDYSDAGKFKIASSTALGSIDRFTIDGNGYVGIGTSTPTGRFEVTDSGTNIPQMILSRESGIHTDFTVAQTTGDLSLNLYGANANDVSLYAQTDISNGANLWVCEGTACPSGISFTGGGNLFVEGVIKYATSTTPKTRRSIVLTAAGAIVPTASGAAQTQVYGTNHSYYVLDFDASSDEAAFWQWTMPDSYDNGSIDITYYWEAGATSGDATFCFQAKGLSANSAEDIDSAMSSAVCETDTAQANANDLASATETNATSNFTAGEYVTFKVFRDVDNGDDMTGDARLVKVKIEYGVATESD